MEIFKIAARQKLDNLGRYHNTSCCGNCNNVKLDHTKIGDYAWYKGQYKNSKRISGGKGVDEFYKICNENPYLDSILVGHLEKLETR